jgi:hypothetical protein
MKHVVRVTEFLTRHVVVEADNSVDAVRKVQNAHYYGEFSLDYEDYDDVDVTHVRIACPGDIERYEEVEVNE